MTGMTLVEKIIARAAGKSTVSPGEVLFVAPDLVILYDWFGLSDWYMDMLDTELHIDNLPHPEKILFFIDHLIPVQNENHRALHGKTRDWCNRNGVKYIEGEGIGHSVVVENGLVRPGMLVAHFDTHISTIGAVGALGFGIMKDLLAPMATGKMWLQVPGTTKITVQGTFQNGVMGRDFLHRLVKDFGPDGCINRVAEFTGPGIENIGVESRMTICDLVNFFGAQSALFAADGKTIDYLHENAGVDAVVMRGDPDATYSDERHYDLGDIEPTLIAPPTISNALSVWDALGTPVSTGIIGTCASGRMEDLKIAARILKHRKVKKGFSLYVIPSSKRMFLKANSEGDINSLVDAGAFVSSPTCDFCFGKAVSLGAGERAISTQTLNVPGRLGSTEAEIYLASSAAVAAAAVTGAIVDPRDYL
jgi:3-isopropylmalate/(R)-2-methylmalate dehydratase large subunit